MFHQSFNYNMKLSRSTKCMFCKHTLYWYQVVESTHLRTSWKILVKIIHPFIYSGLLSNVSNAKCIPVTPMTFNNIVNLTDLFMLKAGCRYAPTRVWQVCNKQISWMISPKWNITFILVIAVSQCLKLQKAIFMNHAFTLILSGITSQQDILGTKTAKLGKTDDIAISFSLIQLTE